MEVSRTEFLQQLGVTVGAGALGGLAAQSVAPVRAEAAVPKGRIPDTPYKIGHMTFLSGPSALLGAPMLKGHLLAAEEINAKGGLLGKRKIETVQADEAAGTDANVKELKRMKLEAKIDAFTGITSSGNTPALGPVAEDLKVLTLFADGCTDFLFDKAVPNPHYVFRITNIQSADGVTCAVAVASTWPQVRKLAFISPDYSYGRNAFQHINVALTKLLPGIQVVSEEWPKLGTTEFTAHITKTISAKPDLLVTSIWGGDYVAFYKQALGYGLFTKMKVATTLALAMQPSVIGKDHPVGVIGGVHANYHFTYPQGGRWPINDAFVRKYHERWNEYPNFEAEGGYTALQMLNAAIERANRLAGGWPEDDAIIHELEGLSWASPAGYIQIRPDNHQAYKDTMIGFTHHDPNYPFTTIDPNRVITIPIRNITAPPEWPKGDPTSTYTWIEKTWPSARA